MKINVPSTISSAPGPAAAAAAAIVPASPREVDEEGGAIIGRCLKL